MTPVARFLCATTGTSIDSPPYRPIHRLPSKARVRKNRKSKEEIEVNTKSSTGNEPVVGKNSAAIWEFFKRNMPAVIAVVIVLLVCLASIIVFVPGTGEKNIDLPPAPTGEKYGEGTAISTSYGPNGSFIAPIDEPDPNAIEISTAQDLDRMRNNMSGSYVLVNDIDLSSFNSGEWIPIGTTVLAQEFSGILDGQGYTISNIKITAGHALAGLFGVTSSEAVIKNVGLENIVINITVSDSVFAGGFCGISGGSIMNCYISGNVSAFAVSGFAYVGGISGISNGNIENSYINCDVSASAAAGFACAGGITGGPGDSDNCYSIGDVSALRTG